MLRQLCLCLCCCSRLPHCLARKEGQIDGKQNLGQLPSSILIWLCGCRCLFASKRNERKLLADTLRKSHEKTLAHFDDVAVAVAVTVAVDVAVNGGCETVRASLKVKKDFQRICEFWLCTLCARAAWKLSKDKQKPSICIYIHTLHTYAKETTELQKNKKKKTKAKATWLWVGVFQQEQYLRDARKVCSENKELNSSRTVK